MTDNHDEPDESETEDNIEAFIRECYREGRMAAIDETTGAETVITTLDKDDN